MHLSEEEVYKELICTKDIKKEPFSDLWRQLSPSEKELYFLRNVKGLQHNEILSQLKLLTPKQELEINKVRNRLKKYVR